LNKRIVVAIDGPAAAGKGEAAKRLAARLGFLHIDTGAMYRAVALWASRSGIGFDDQHRVASLAEHASIRLTEDRRVWLNDEEITPFIRTPEIDQGASRVSAIPAVRRALVAEQQKMAESASIVMEGRDIGTVVFPNAQVKFFLDAAPEERARRRQRQQLVEKGLTLDFDSVLKEIRERDLRDSSRADSPLRQAADAIVVDTTQLTPDQVEEELLRLVRERTSNGKEVTR
jgi:cytidylate kinase